MIALNEDVDKTTAPNKFNLSLPAVLFQEFTRITEAYGKRRKGEVFSAAILLLLELDDAASAKIRNNYGPLMEGRFFVFSHLTEIEPDTHLRIEMVEPDEQPLFSRDTACPVAARDQDAFAAVEITTTFKTQGLHFIRLWWQDEILSQRRLKIDYLKTDPRAKWRG